MAHTCPRPMVASPPAWTSVTDVAPWSSEQLTVAYLDATLQSTVSLVLLLVVLMFRPNGLIGRQVRTL